MIWPNKQGAKHANVIGRNAFNDPICRGDYPFGRTNGPFASTQI